MLGDNSDPRENLVSLYAGFAADSTATVEELTSYALERSAYDESYVANKTEVEHTVRMTGIVKQAAGGGRGGAAGRHSP